jgi:flagellar protein FlbD
MIKLTRLNHIPLIVNSDLIDHIEMTPDTIVTLTSGQKFMVLESADEIVDSVIAFRRSIFSKELYCPNAESSTPQSSSASSRLDRESSSHGR